MRLKKIKAFNFRNYEKIEETFTKDKNIFILTGDNAQGKTNFLEALYLLKFGCLFENKSTNSAIKFNEKNAKVSLLCETIKGNIKIEVIFDNKKKKFFINNKTVKGPVDIKGKIQIITFLPQDLNIIKLGPIERRKFFNEELSSAIPRYFECLKYYNYSLKQKNILLKQNVSKSYINIWNERIIKYGSALIYDRIKYIYDIDQYLKKIHLYISGKKELAEIKYKTFIKSNNEKEIKEEFKQILSKYLNEEIKKGFSLIGPHRDDFKFLINKEDIKKFSSQGQKRNFLLSIKISKIEYIKEKYKEYPIVLLDDVFSELDIKRKNNLLKYISNRFQVFITSVEDFKYNRKISEKIIIKEGKIFREK